MKIPSHVLSAIEKIRRSYAKELMADIIPVKPTVYVFRSKKESERRKKSKERLGGI